MNHPAIQTLCDVLDRHITLMRELVELSQREQQHLLAFEVRAVVRFSLQSLSNVFESFLCTDFRNWT